MQEQKVSGIKHIDAHTHFILRAKKVTSPFMDVFWQAQRDCLKDRECRGILVRQGQIDIRKGIYLVSAGFLNQQSSSDTHDTDGMHVDLIYFRDGLKSSPKECIGIRIWRANLEVNLNGIYDPSDWASNASFFYEDEIVGPGIAVYSKDSAELAIDDLRPQLYAAIDEESTIANQNTNDPTESALLVVTEELLALFARIGIIYGIEPDELFALTMDKLGYQAL